MTNDFQNCKRRHPAFRSLERREINKLEVSFQNSRSAARSDAERELNNAFGFTPDESALDRENLNDDWTERALPWMMIVTFSVGVLMLVGIVWNAIRGVAELAPTIALTLVCVAIRYLFISMVVKAIAQTWDQEYDDDF